MADDVVHETGTHDLDDESGGLQLSLVQVLGRASREKRRGHPRELGGKAQCCAQEVGQGLQRLVVAGTEGLGCMGDDLEHRDLIGPATQGQGEHGHRAGTSDRFHVHSRVVARVIGAHDLAGQQGQPRNALVNT